MKKKTTYGYLLEQAGMSIRKIKIRIHEINDNNIFPVKFSYRQRGYKNLIFSARNSEIELA